MKINHIWTNNSTTKIFIDSLLLSEIVKPCSHFSLNNCFFFKSNQTYSRFKMSTDEILRMISSSFLNLSSTLPIIRRTKRVITHRVDKTKWSCPISDRPPNLRISHVLFFKPHTTQFFLLRALHFARFPMMLFVPLRKFEVNSTISMVWNNQDHSGQFYCSTS